MTFSPGMAVQPAEQVQLLHLARQEAGCIDLALRADLAEATAGCDPLLTESLQEALFTGGKRIRPLLVLLALRLSRPDPGTVQDGYPLAIAFEYLHAATLIHDDVIDQAPERRGRPALWHAHGLAAAILAGDWLHARAMHLVGQQSGAEGLAVFCQATRSMVEGEFLQLRHRNDRCQTEAQYLEIVERKTAGLIAAACEVGAILAAAGPEARVALSCYGRYLGLAFQLVDDILDYHGQEQATGKQPGTDWIEGQLTLPLLHVLQQGGAAVAPALVKLFDQQNRRAGLEEARSLIEGAGGFRYARSLAEHYGEQARRALREGFAAAAGAELTVLLALVDYVLSRDR